MLWVLQIYSIIRLEVWIFKCTFFIFREFLRIFDCYSVVWIKYAANSSIISDSNQIKPPTNCTIFCFQALNNFSCISYSNHLFTRLWKNISIFFGYINEYFITMYRVNAVKEVGIWLNRQVLHSYSFQVIICWNVTIKNSFYGQIKQSKAKCLFPVSFVIGNGYSVKVSQ